MKIKEVEKLLQMNSQTIRYYDKLGFLHPNRDNNGYRNYSMDDVTILKKIRFLRELDISLELIERILKDQHEFQNILDQHINKLQTQAENLEDIRQKCKDVIRNNISLLDAVVEDELSSDIKIEREFNDTVKGSVDSTPSYPHMIIGRKTKKSQLIKASIMLLVVIILLGKSIFSFPKYSVEQSFPWLMFIVFVLVVWIIFGLLVFHEKYYEFRDDDFYIYDSKKHKIQGLIAVLKNQTHKYSDHYFYKSIAHVVIRINKKYRGIGYGPEECFDVTYKFIMTNGKRFEINSSYYNQQDQNRKSVYDILENNHVHIIDKQNFKEAISQTEMPLYDYLKKNI